MSEYEHSEESRKVGDDDVNHIERATPGHEVTSGLVEELPETGDKLELENMLLQNREKLKALAEKSPYSKYRNPSRAFDNLCNLLSTKNRLKDQKGMNKERFNDNVIQVWNNWKKLNRFPIQEI